MTEAPQAEEADPREEEVAAFCEIAEGHLAAEGCHDTAAKAAIKAIARTLILHDRD